MNSCELCGSSNDKLNFHHLIPKSLHHSKKYKNKYDKQFLSKGIWICQSFCHKEIHKFITEKEMGQKYNTLEMLYLHPKVRKYIEWRKKRN